MQSSEITTIRVKYIGIPELLDVKEEFFNVKEKASVKNALQALIESRSEIFGESIADFLSRFWVFVEEEEGVKNIRLLQGINTLIKNKQTLIITSPISGG